MSEEITWEDSKKELDVSKRKMGRKEKDKQREITLLKNFRLDCGTSCLPDTIA
jgi:hypothetical protein